MSQDIKSQLMTHVNMIILNNFDKNQIPIKK